MKLQVGECAQLFSKSLTNKEVILNDGKERDKKKWSYKEIEKKSQVMCSD